MIRHWQRQRSVPALIDNLRSSVARYEVAKNGTEHDKSFASASHSIISLGQLGPDASAAVSAIIEALEGPEMCYRNGDRSIRTEAAAALSRIGPDSVGPLIHSLRSNEWQVRHLAARSLGEIARSFPTKGDAVIHPLATATEDKHQWVRIDAILALAQFGPAAAPAASALEKALEDSDEQVRKTAQYAIEQIHRVERMSGSELR